MSMVGLFVRIMRSTLSNVKGAVSQTLQLLEIHSAIPLQLFLRIIKYA